MIELLRAVIKLLRAMIAPLQAVIKLLQAMIAPLRAMIAPLQAMIKLLQVMIEPLQAKIRVIAGQSRGAARNSKEDSPQRRRAGHEMQPVAGDTASVRAVRPRHAPGGFQ